MADIMTIREGSFDRTLPTPRFYPPPPGHPTSTVGCLCGGMHLVRNNGWFCGESQRLRPLRRVYATLSP